MNQKIINESVTNITYDTYIWNTNYEIAYLCEYTIIIEMSSSIYQMIDDKILWNIIDMYRINESKDN